MKNILSTIIVLSISMVTMAQTSFNWTLNDSIVTDIDANSYTELKIEQTNISGGDLDLAIEVIYNDIPSTWDGMVCVEGLCMGTIPAVGGTANMTTIADGANGYVRLTANPMGGLEQILLKIRVYDVDNPSDSDTATWLINSVDLLSVNENGSNTSINLYPNPSNSEFSINSTSNIDSVELIGLDGKTVLSKQIKSNESLNINHLPKGLYIVKIYSQGNLVGVEKMIKND